MELADSHPEAHQLLVYHRGHLGAAGQKRGKGLVGVGVSLLRHEGLGAVEPERRDPQGLDRRELRPNEGQLPAGCRSSGMPRELVVQGFESESRFRILPGLDEERAELRKGLSPELGVPALRDRSKELRGSLAVSRALQERAEEEPRLIENGDIAVVGIDLLKELAGFVGTVRLELARREKERVAFELRRLDGGRTEELDGFGSSMILRQEHPGGEGCETPLRFRAAVVLVDRPQGSEPLPEVRPGDARQGRPHLAQVVGCVEHRLPGKEKRLGGLGSAGFTFRPLGEDGARFGREDQEPDEHGGERPEDCRE